MPTAGRNAQILLNGYDVSGAFNDWDLSGEAKMDETTTFGAAVDSTSYTETLKGAKLGLKGFWDGTAVTGISAILEAALGNVVKSIVCLFPFGSAVGNEMIAFQGDEKTKKLPNKVTGVLSIQTDFESSTGPEYGVSLHVLQQETVGANGTTVDNGAASTNGGSAFLEATAVGTTMTVNVRHSTDNFGADDTLLGSFSAQTVIGAQRIAFAAGTTVKRYVRITWTQTGNTTFAVGLHRN